MPEQEREVLRKKPETRLRRAVEIGGREVDILYPGELSLEETMRVDVLREKVDVAVEQGVPVEERHAMLIQLLSYIFPDPPSDAELKAESIDYLRDIHDFFAREAQPNRAERRRKS